MSLIRAEFELNRIDLMFCPVQFVNIAYLRSFSTFSVDETDEMVVSFGSAMLIVSGNGSVSVSGNGRGSGNGGGSVSVSVSVSGNGGESGS